MDSLRLRTVFTYRHRDALVQFRRVAVHEPKRKAGGVCPLSQKVTFKAVIARLGKFKNASLRFFWGDVGFDEP